MFPVTLHWASVSTYELAVRALEPHVRAYLWVLIFPFLLILALSYRQARRFSESRRILDRPVTDLDARALAIFLSPVRQDADLAERLSAHTGPDDLRELRTRKKFLGPWRMALEATAHHLRGPNHLLERIMVLTSPETAPLFPVFEKLIRNLTPELRLRIEHIANFNDGAYAAGIDFHDPRLLESVIEHVYGYYRRAGIPERDVLIDITGGFKTTSVVGAIVALKESRRIQYVEFLESESTFKMRFFDLGYSAIE